MSLFRGRFNCKTAAVALLLVLALAVRIFWAVTRDAVIENEGAEYTRIAMNLASGHGYVGLMAGPEMLFPPLYPVLIRIGMFLFQDAVTSARAVSIIAGTLLVLVLFLTANLLYGKRVGLVAGALGALYPMFVGFSAATYSEGVYATLIASVLYFALLTLRLPSARYAIPLGIALGLAYLTKPEAIAQMGIVLAGIAVAGLISRNRKSFAAIAIVLVCFALFALPYVIFLYRHTHHLRLEGKSEVNYVIISRINSGLDPGIAAAGVSDAGEDSGPLITPNSFIGKPAARPHGVREAVNFFATAASRNWRAFVNGLLPTYFVLPIVALCAIALFREPWSARRLGDEMLFALMLALACVSMLLTPFISWRFVLPFMPFLIIWMAKGMDELSLWSKETLVNSLGGESRWSYAQSLVAAALVLAVLVAGAKATEGMVALSEARADSLYLKEAGLALRDRAQGKTVMDLGTIVAFYSGATWLPTPAGSVAGVSRFIDLHQPDFVVVHPSNDRAWQQELATAIAANPRAHLLFSKRNGELLVFELLN